MGFQDINDLPIEWTDHEDIAMALYDRFGDEFTEGKIYRIRFTDLLDWILEIPNFEGKREDSSDCLLYTSPSPRDATLSRMPSSA